MHAGGHHPKTDAEKKKEEKEKKLLEQKELAALFKPVQAQKVEKGTDPKSVVCAFFKQGNCSKGDKCKFSHDLTIENKVSISRLSWFASFYDLNLAYRPRNDQSTWTCVTMRAMTCRTGTRTSYRRSSIRNIRMRSVVPQLIL